MHANNNFCLLRTSFYEVKHTHIRKAVKEDKPWGKQELLTICSSHCWCALSSPNISRFLCVTMRYQFWSLHFPRKISTSSCCRPVWHAMQSCIAPWINYGCHQLLFLKKTHKNKLTLPLSTAEWTSHMWLC